MEAKVTEGFRLRWPLRGVREVKRPPLGTLPSLASSEDLG